MLVALSILLVSNYILAYDGEPRHYYDLEEAEDYFSWFVESYNKTYTKYEAKKRFEIFKQNLKTANKDNFGLSSPVFGITQFSDLTVEEFKQKYTCLKFEDDDDEYCDKKTEINVQMYGDVPEQFDWRDRNVVTSVKDQAMCGSCWAFGATGNVESANAIKNGQLIDLSPQQLVDCDRNSAGCLGGFPSSGFKSIMKLGGQEKEADYPYTAEDGKCKFDKSKVQVNLKSCSAYKIGEEKAKQLLVQNGPLTIGVDATSFHSYQSGILSNCHFEAYNHAVLLVGYGSENNKDYWIIKNSWGTTVGEKGYIRLERGVNACGIDKTYFETVEIA